MVAHAPALFDPLVSDWRLRLAELRRVRAAPADDPARVEMKSRVLRFMLAQYSIATLKYVPPVNLVSSIRWPEEALLRRITRAGRPLEWFVGEGVPRAAATPVVPPAAAPAQASITGLIIYGPISRSVRQDFITLFSFYTGCCTTHATAIANLVNKKSAAFVRASPLVADRLRQHLLPYQIKADLHPAAS